MDNEQIDAIVTHVDEMQVFRAALKTHTAALEAHDKALSKHNKALNDNILNFAKIPHYLADEIKKEVEKSLKDIKDELEKSAKANKEAADSMFTNVFLGSSLAFFIVALIAFAVWAFLLWR